MGWSGKAAHVCVEVVGKLGSISFVYNYCFFVYNYCFLVHLNYVNDMTIICINECIMHIAGLVSLARFFVREMIF
jgi:hypothetical protein